MINYTIALLLAFSFNTMVAAKTNTRTSACQITFVIHHNCMFLIQDVNTDTVITHYTVHWVYLVKNYPQHICITNMKLLYSCTERCD